MQNLHFFLSVESMNQAKIQKIEKPFDFQGVTLIKEESKTQNPKVMLLSKHKKFTLSLLEKKVIE